MNSKEQNIQRSAYLFAEAEVKRALLAQGIQPGSKLWKEGLKGIRKPIVA